MILISKITTREAAEEIANDPKKFAKFVEFNKRFLKSIVSRIHNKDNYDDEDLYQESLISLYSALKKYNPEERTANGKTSGTFSTYSFKLIMNDVMRFINGENKTITEEKSIEICQNLFENPSKPSDNIFKNERLKGGMVNNGFEDEVIRKIDNDRIMLKLTSIEREIFKKRIVQKMTHDAVAADLKIPGATYATIYYKSFLPKLKSVGYDLINSVD